MKHRALLHTMAGLMLVGGMTSCVSQDEHQRAIALAEMYQDEKLALEAELARKNQMVDQLTGEINTVEARARQENSGGVSPEELLSLQDQLRNLDRAPKGVERFTVDGGYVYMIQDNVLFASGSAAMSDDGAKEIRSLAARIKAEPHGQIFVRGHTDSDPIKKPATQKKFPKGNLQLSSERAVSVARILIDDGKIGAKNVTTMGFGQHQPVKVNNSAENKRLNRRVEIFVADPATP
jgi:chemotaxis protein MotB